MKNVCMFDVKCLGKKNPIKHELSRSSFYLLYFFANNDLLSIMSNFCLKYALTFNAPTSRRELIVQVQSTVLQLDFFSC